MFELYISAMVFASLLGSYWIGHLLRLWMPDEQRSAEVVAVARLVVGMLITFTALILSLLTNSVKASYDFMDTTSRAYAAQIIEIDNLLRAYGPEAQPLREILREYTERTIVTTWTSEPPPPNVSLPSPAAVDLGGVEGKIQSKMLFDLQNGIRALDSSDRVRQLVAQDARVLVRKLVDLRWTLIESQHNSIPTPFMILVVVWMMIIFASFGLEVKETTVNRLIVMFVAASLSSVIYLMLDLDSLFDGLIALSSQPFRDALAHLRA
jgi:hypothetical protein